MSHNWASIHMQAMCKVTQYNSCLYLCSPNSPGRVISRIRYVPDTDTTTDTYRRSIQLKINEKQIRGPIFGACRIIHLEAAQSTTTPLSTIPAVCFVYLCLGWAGAVAAGLLIPLSSCVHCSINTATSRTAAVPQMDVALQTILKP